MNLHTELRALIERWRNSGGAEHRCLELEAILARANPEPGTCGCCNRCWCEGFDRGEQKAREDLDRTVHAVNGRLRAEKAQLRSELESARAELARIKTTAHELTGWNWARLLIDHPDSAVVEKGMIALEQSLTTPPAPVSQATSEPPACNGDEELRALRIDPDELADRGEVFVARLKAELGKPAPVACCAECERGFPCECEPV